MFNSGWHLFLFLFLLSYYIHTHKFVLCHVLNPIHRLPHNQWLIHSGDILFGFMFTG